MKIHFLIEQLQELQDRCGDIDVFVKTIDECGYISHDELDDIDVYDEYILLMSCPGE